MVQRKAWIDAAKGGLILSVVAGHVLVSSIDAGLLDARSALAVVNFVIYNAHMPAFFWLAGMCVRGRLEREGRGEFLARNARTLAWPYLVWGAIFLAGQAALGGARNTAGTVALDWSLLWTPIAWLWFLVALFLFHALASAIRPAWLFALSLALLALTASDTLFLRQLGLLLPLYALGLWRGPALLSLRAEFAGPAAIGAALLAYVIGGGELYTIASLPAALLSVATVIDLAQRFPAEPLQWLGQRCFAIYISHFFFITATRIALLKVFGVTALTWHMPLAFAAGLGGSLALLAASQRFGLATGLGFGKLPTSSPFARWSRGLAAS